MPPAPLPLSARSRRTTDSPISYFIRKAIETPGLISFAAGLVDEGSLPAAEVGAAVTEIMADPAAGQAALQYGSTQGLPGLREKVVHHVCAADGVTPDGQKMTAEDVLITTGSQQLLYLLGEALFDEGDIVITEAPSYFVYHDCLKTHGAKVLPVPMDGGGMNLDALEDLLSRLDSTGELQRLKLIYTVDFYQNPTGLTLAEDRRPRLVELARRYSKHNRVLILEDAAYRELGYDGRDLPSVKRFDGRNEHVVYTGTFSKPCAPGLKTGYALLPKGLAAPLCNLKGSHDFGSTNLAQHVIDHLMATGAYHRHVQVLQGVYREKRDAMLAALAAEFADWPEVKWTHPTGGLYVWLSFPPDFDAGPGGKLVQRALAEGVLYVPGQYAHVPDEFGGLPRNEARLCFGVATPGEVTEGVRRLRRACGGLEESVRGRKAARVG
jgi:2-aminoadipate transaminase